MTDRGTACHAVAWPCASLVTHRRSGRHSATAGAEPAVSEVTRPHKPRDVGNGIVCASFGAYRRVAQPGRRGSRGRLRGAHGPALFDPELRGDTEAVLRYRSWMRREEHAFLRVEAGRATRRLARGCATRYALRRAAARHLGLAARPASRHPRPRQRAAGPPDAGPDQLSRRSTRSRAPDRPQSRVKSARRHAACVRGGGAPVIIQAWLRHGGRVERGLRRGALRPAPGVAGTLRRRMPSAVAWIDWPADAEEVHLDIACTFDRAVA